MERKIYIFLLIQELSGRENQGGGGYWDHQKNANKTSLAKFFNIIDIDMLTKYFYSAHYKKM